MTCIIRYDDGDREEISIDDYCDEARDEQSTGKLTRATTLANKNAMLAEDALKDYVRRGGDVVERAKEEDVMVAEVRVPFWFRDDDDEVAATFNGDDSVVALVEDYSEKAWRIVASEHRAGTGDVVYDYDWTFVPKSVATVTTVGGFSDPEEARRATDEMRSARREITEQIEEDWENADGWEEKLEQV